MKRIRAKEKTDKKNLKYFEEQNFNGLPRAEILKHIHYDRWFSFNIPWISQGHPWKQMQGTLKKAVSERHINMKTFSLNNRKAQFLKDIFFKTPLTEWV